MCCNANLLCLIKRYIITTLKAECVVNGTLLWVIKCYFIPPRINEEKFGYLLPSSINIVKLIYQKN